MGREEARAATASSRRPLLESEASGPRSFSRRDASLSEELQKEIKERSMAASIATRCWIGWTVVLAAGSSPVFCKISYSERAKRNARKACIEALAWNCPATATQMLRDYEDSFCSRRDGIDEDATEGLIASLDGIWQSPPKNCCGAKRRRVSPLPTLIGDVSRLSRYSLRVLASMSPNHDDLASLVSRHLALFESEDSDPDRGALQRHLQYLDRLRARLR